jgi:hypothetical protein
MTRSIPKCIALIIFAFTAIPAAAHDAPAGWSYDVACCHNKDCRPIPSSSVKESPRGYLITIDNEVVPYTDARIKDSPDGMYHWCTANGRNDTRTICLYVPPRGY